MNRLPYFFTYEEGNLLIRLLLAHLLADFVFQSSGMVKDKKWISRPMRFHISSVFILTFLCSFSWSMTILITLTHWLVDSIKMNLLKKYPGRESHLFFADQLLHVLCILFIWAGFLNKESILLNAICYPFLDYHLSLIIFAYAFVMWPVGYALKFALRNIAKTTNSSPEEKVEHGGKLIGLFERVIILTFVLLNQYEAIGFLITGKSIIRFAQTNENLRSEYVLLGTMMSYAVSIITGALVNWLIHA